MNLWGQKQQWQEGHSNMTGISGVGSVISGQANLQQGNQKMATNN